MKTLKPFRLSVLTRPYRWRGADQLGVAVIGLATLDADPVLLPEQDLWQLVGDELGPTGVLDLAIPKAAPEYLASGHAYTAHQADKTACAARIAFAGCDKTLVVHGDRYWLDGRATPPAPFERMRLDWTRAWGGPAVADNPVGIGAAEETLDGLRVHRLPNVEAPDAPVRHPGQAGRPASFHALDPTWPQRFSRIGTQYGPQWLERDFPGFADDIDWRFFNAAPLDQQVAGALELPRRAAYRIWNMHPSRHLIQGRLPDWRARCFVRRRDAAAIDEVGLRLTTAWFFPDRERMVLIWHGALPVAEDDGADVTVIMPALEAADAALPPEHYAAVLGRRLDPTQGAAHALRDADLVCAPALGAWPAAELPDPSARPTWQRIAAGVERNREAERARLEAEGLDPETWLPAPPAPPTPPAMDQLAELIARADAAAEQARATLEQARTEALDEAGGAPAAPRLDLADLQGDAPGTTEAAASHAARERVRALLREAYQHAARDYAPSPRLAPDVAVALRETVLARHAANRDLAGMNLAGADLAGLDLAGARLTGALLENADLSGARLDGCDLSGAVLVRAVLTGATLRQARLIDANLGLAHCEGADFSGADFGGADCRDARLAGCSLRGANFSRTQLDGAHIEDCDFSDASLSGISFLKQQLVRARFPRARIERAMWIDCGLLQPDFGGALLVSCGFFQTRADAPDFSGATLETCSFAHETAFTAACFRGATLRQCGLRAIPLARADFTGARLENCDLSAADLTDSRFDGADATDCLFVRTNFAGASLRDADLLQAVLQKANLQAADLAGANLFRADLGQAALEASLNAGDAHTRQAKLWPARRHVERA